MTVDDIIDRLQSLKRAGRISGDDTVVTRDPSVSSAAFSAGSDLFAEVDEILAPGQDRVMLLSFGWDDDLDPGD